MTDILLLSDTHGYIDKDILKFAELSDEVWHAGDIGDHKVTDSFAAVAKLRAVYGNIDDASIRSTYPKQQRFLCEKVDVWMLHIGGYPGRYSAEVRDYLRKSPPKIFICGHSHILKVIPDNSLNLIHMNPGAAGKHGFHKVRTMLRFKIHEDRISDLEAIELSPR